MPDCSNPNPNFIDEEGDYMDKIKKASGEFDEYQKHINL